jgi:hypothetical protein
MSLMDKQHETHSTQAMAKHNEQMQYEKPQWVEPSCHPGWLKVRGHK